MSEDPSNEGEKYRAAAESYMNSAETALTAKEYQKVGTDYFNAGAAALQAACLSRGVTFTGKEDYFIATEELTSLTGVEWVERSLCQLLILQQNDEKGFLTHGQVRRFAQDARRVVRWLLKQ